MDTNTYHTKMPTLIENELYQLLNKDPTERLTRKLSEKLLTLKRSGYSSEAVYNKIRPRHKQFTEDSQGRCTLKTYYAYLANILSPSTGNLDLTVTNSAHFVSTISNETILDNEIMVSLDVESLFTNLPIDAAGQAALQN